MSDGKSFANGNGECQAGSVAGYLWLRLQPEFREVWESRFCSWTVMA